MTRIEGLDGMREAPPLNITELVEAAKVRAQTPVVHVPEPEPAWTGPKEGSAAWRAEQIAMGNVEIPTRPVRLDAAPQPLGGQQPAGWSSAAREAWNFLGVVPWLVALAVIAFVAFRFVTGGAPSEREVNNAFVDVPGYQYQEQEIPQIEELESWIADYPGWEDSVSHVEFRLVTKDGYPAGVVVIAGIDPADATRSGFARDVDAFARGARPVTLGGTGAKSVPAYEFTSMGSFGTMFVDEDGFLIVTAGNNATHVSRIATALGVGNL